MIKEELKEELEKELEEIKDFKVYVFEWDLYVKAEDYKKKAIECRELRRKVKNLESRLNFNDSDLDDFVLI